MKYGFVTVAAAIPAVRVADVDFNLHSIEREIARAEGRGVEVVCFPELCITGYSCQDLFREQLLLDKADEALMRLLDFTRKLDVISIVGLPVVADGLLLNCAAVIQKGCLLGVVPKTYLPNYNEFYEKRWFASARELRDTEICLAGNTVVVSSRPKLFATISGMRFGVEVCEDAWAPVPPSDNLALAGADVIFNLSASNELIGKHAYLKALLAQQSARTISGYVYSGCGFGESTQDVVYGGNALVYENGHLLCEGDRFSIEPQLLVAQVDVERLRAERRVNSTFVGASRMADADVVGAKPVEARDFIFMRDVDPLPFIPQSPDMAASCEEVLGIQTLGLAQRLRHTGSKRVVLGISGGLDSTLALLVCVRAFDKLGLDRKGIVGVTMPGFGTTGRTHANATSLMASLGVSSREISIADSVSRTYNGDHMSMYGVNSGVPKTLIRHLVRYVAMADADEKTKATLLDIIDTPISPELIPADGQGNICQKTEDLVGPYELHDFFLYYFVRFGFRPAKIFMLACRAFNGSHPEVEHYDESTIRHWLTTFCRRFFSQQFKRSCLPDGPKVGSVALSPRGDWRMPSDASAALWAAECEGL